MKSTYFTIHLGKNPPPQNDFRLISVILYFFPQSTGFTSSTFPIQPDSSQNQPINLPVVVAVAATSCGEREGERASSVT
jgi:hypothetical protein